MFERLILDFVNPLISTYIPQIDSDQFALRLLSGQLMLEDLQLKVNPLNHLISIPFHIDSISIARVYAGLNWTKLFSQPVTIELEGIRIICRDKTQVDWDEKMLVGLIQDLKMATLDSIEKSELAKEENRDGCPMMVSNENEGRRSSIALMKWIFVAVRNLIFDIKDIHISYVHFKGNGIGEPNVVLENEIECVAGLGIERITLNQGEDNVQVLKFQNVFLYCNTEPSQFFVPPLQGASSSSSVVSTSSRSSRFDPAIVAAQSAPADLNVIQGEGSAKTIRSLMDRAPICALSVPSILMEYQNQFGFVFEPFTLDLGMKLGADTQPVNVVSIRLHADVSLDATLDEKQLISILRIFNHIGRVSQRQAQVLEAMQRTRFRCANAQEQTLYIDLYNRTLNADWLEDLSKEEEQKKTQFERELSLADLTFLRKAALAEIQSQKGVGGIGAKMNPSQIRNRGPSSESSSPSVTHRKKKKWSWWSRLWGYSDEEDQKASVYLSEGEKQIILGSITKEYEESLSTGQQSPISPAKTGTEPKASPSSEFVSSIPILPPASLPFHLHFELTLCIPKISLGIYSGAALAPLSGTSSTSTPATDALPHTFPITNQTDSSGGDRIVVVPAVYHTPNTFPITMDNRSGLSGSSSSRPDREPISTTRTDADPEASQSEISRRSSISSTTSASASVRADSNGDQLIQLYLCGSHLCLSLQTFEQKCLFDFAVISVEMHDMSSDGENEMISEMDSEIIELDKAYRQILLISPSVNPIATDSILAGTTQTDPVSTPAGGTSSESGVHQGPSCSGQSGGSEIRSSTSSRMASTSVPQVQKPIRLTFTTPQRKSKTPDNKTKSDREGMNLLDIQLMNIRFQFNPVLNRLAEIFNRASPPSIQPPSYIPPEAIGIGNVKEAEKTAVGLPGHRCVNIFDDVAFNELLSIPPGRTMCSHLFPPDEPFLTFLLSLATPVDIRVRMFHPLIQIMMDPRKVKPKQDHTSASPGAKSSISSPSVPAFIIEWSIKGDGEIDRDRQYVGLNASINNLHCFATSLSSENATLDHQKKLSSNLESPHENCLIEPIALTVAYQQHQQIEGAEKKTGLKLPTVQLNSISNNVFNPSLPPSVSKQLHVELTPLNVRLNSSLAELILLMMESGVTDNPMAQSALNAGLTFLTRRGRI